MLRTSSLLWLAAVLLVVYAAFSGLYGLVQAARLTHSTDVYYDDVCGPFVSLVDGGAVDLDKAAAVSKMASYAGASQAERKEFERKVLFKAMDDLAKPVIVRVEEDIAVASVFGFATAGVCVIAALIVGIQAVRIGKAGREARTNLSVSVKV